jgi:hypothetical protein
MDDGAKETADTYAEFYEDEKSLFEEFCLLKKTEFFFVEIVVKQRRDLWNKTRKVFLRAEKAQKKFRRIAIEHVEHLGDSRKV